MWGWGFYESIEPCSGSWAGDTFVSLRPKGNDLPQNAGHRRPEWKAAGSERLAVADLHSAAFTHAAALTFTLVISGPGADSDGHKHRLRVRLERDLYLAEPDSGRDPR